MIYLDIARSHSTRLALARSQLIEVEAQEKLPRRWCYTETACKKLQMEFLAQIYEKVISAILAIPTTKDWIVATMLLLMIISICLPLGIWCKFLEIRIPKLSARGVISVLVSRFLFPYNFQDVQKGDRFARRRQRTETQFVLQSSYSYAS